jgi:hypothetical protein
MIIEVEKLSSNFTNVFAFLRKGEKPLYFEPTQSGAFELQWQDETFKAKEILINDLPLKINKFVCCSHPGNITEYQAVYQPQPWYTAITTWLVDDNTGICFSLVHWRPGERQFGCPWTKSRIKEYLEVSV